MFRRRAHDYQSFLTQYANHPAADAAREAMVRLTARSRDQLMAVVERCRMRPVEAGRRIFSPRARPRSRTQWCRNSRMPTGRHHEHVAATRAEFPAYETERDASRRIKEDSTRGSTTCWSSSRSAWRPTDAGVRRRRCGRGAQVYRRPRPRSAAYAAWSRASRWRPRKSRSTRRSRRPDARWSRPTSASTSFHCVSR